ncbi:DUF5119 domain-containing protein [Bacteroides thetaiotaomicron]|uniref:DUF5119 domain-containing protein n=1 Tax=Bacteroides thetaiotaomicron TaxID=818 RepID=UPI001C8C1ED1|nr:DUF5119 domain-containing protein [Bacteroides thetaiotaomicron]MBX9049608.1 DUF5119 domain-containing protein [Bacteroides thetaiotaomicron]MBX9074258.1 DUF5119 domain-containing protein [Bacteroides thetaiotaomicron]
MRRLILITLICAALASCQHRDLTDYGTSSTALIPVRIDWSQTGLDPDNDPNQDVKGASVWLFPQQGSAYQGPPKEYKLNNPRGEDIEVPVGIYSVLVFNNTVREFPSERVGFRGTDSYETFEYYAKPDTRGRFALTRSGEDNVIHEPDILAAWHLDRFEVTVDMITRTRSGSLSRATGMETTLSNVIPQRLTRTIKTLVHVERLNVATAAEGAVAGFGSSVFLSTGRVDNVPSMFGFSLNNRRWTDSEQRNGTIESEFESFGLLSSGTAQYTHYTLFTLRTEHEGSTTFPAPPAPAFAHDVSYQITGSGAIRLNIVIGVGLDVRDPVITLPDIVIPGGGGFDVDVDDWGDDEVIEIR